MPGMDSQQGTRDPRLTMPDEVTPETKAKMFARIRDFIPADFCFAAIPGAIKSAILIMYVGPLTLGTPIDPDVLDTIIRELQEIRAQLKEEAERSGGGDRSAKEG